MYVLDKHIGMTNVKKKNKEKDSSFLLSPFVKQVFFTFMMHIC